MSEMTIGWNVAAYSAQIGLLIGASAGIPRLLRVRSPGVQFIFWRALLVLSLALPLLQPWSEPASGRLAPSTTGTMVTAIPVISVSAATAAHSGARLTGGRLTSLVLFVLLGGTAARLLWICVGLHRLRRLRRAGEPADSAADDYEDLQRTIGTHAAIRWSVTGQPPVTFGLFRPVILLPERVRMLPLEARRAVVCHELFHVRRRDWAWLLAEEVVRAVFWFHPLMWWLLTRVQLARETLVDELSILATNARKVYLDTLLTFADDRPFAPATAFSRRRHLFYRIMLLSREGTMSARRVLMACAAFVIVAGVAGWTGVRAFPLQGERAAQTPRDPKPGAYSPEKDAQFRLLVQRFEEAIAREPNNPEAHHNLATVYYERAAKDGALTMDQRLQHISMGLAEEDRALAIDGDFLPAIVYKSVMLRMRARFITDPQQIAALTAEADRLRQRGSELQLIQPPPPPPPPAQSRREMPPPPPPPPPPGMDEAIAANNVDFEAAVAALQPIKIGGDMKAPNKTRDVRPVYPPIAQSARVQGVVIIEVVIDSDGSVRAARVRRSIPLLDQAALDAVRGWRYQPPLLNGQPVAFQMTVTVNFTLQ